MANSKKNILLKVYLVYTTMLIFAVAILVRMCVLMFVEGEELKQMSEEKSFRMESVNAIRGNIYSVDHQLLATSVTEFTLRMDLHKSVVDKETYRRYIRPLCDSLHKMFPSKSASEYYRILNKARNQQKRAFLLKKNLSYAQLNRIKTFPILNRGQFKGGLIVEEHEKRRRPYNLLAERTIGYYNKVSDRSVGLEAAYDDYLSGTSGERLTRRVSNGVWRPVYSNREVEPENGKDVITTIDIRIQDVAEAALMRCLQENEADYGTTVLMEVASGEVRAIANLRRNTDGTYSEAMNYAINDCVEPGSTFKLASLIAILEEGRGYDTNTIVPTGVLDFHGRDMIDSRRSGYGDISLKEAFEKSSNVGISYASYDLFNKRPQAFIDYLYEMGINKPLGLEIQGEISPFIKNTKHNTWSKLTVPWMTIGYELKMTPLQILSLYNAVANNGTMVKPFFVKEIREGDRLVYENSTVVLKQKICSQKTLERVKDCLEGVVTQGTAKSLSKSPYKVAGKTGTAQMNYGKKGEKITYRASFAGYFPADKPIYSCIVMITNPQKNKRYGGELSAPVFKEIADKVYATLLTDFAGMPVDLYAESCQYPNCGGGKKEDVNKIFRYLGYPEAKSSAEYIKVNPNEERLEYQVLNTSKESMPNLKGLGVRDAIYILESMGLQVQVRGKGKVLKQSLNPGSSLYKGALVELILG